MFSFIFIYATYVLAALSANILPALLFMWAILYSVLEDVGYKKGDSYTVRAANEMGGLSETSNAYVVSDASGIENVNKTASPVSVEIYTSTGVRVAAPVQGVTIKRTLMDDGSIVITKEITE